MNIGIVAEGRSDQNVIENILKSFSIENHNVKKLRPELAYDATDIYQKNRTFGGWQNVKNDCTERDIFDKFFYINENKFVIIQIDTAECEEKDFGVSKPLKNNLSEYSISLRNQVIEKINNWLENKYTDKLFYAISIEEIESWILTKYIDGETTKSANPKTKLQRIITEKAIKSKATTEADFYKEITKEFGKPKLLNVYKDKNQSLKDFVDSLTILTKKNNDEVQPF